MPSTNLTVWFERVSEPECGIWCDRCNLPSGVTMTMSMQFGSTGSLSLTTFTRCLDCCEPIEGQ